MTLGAAWGGEEAAQREFFERKIRPVLVAKCYQCHSADAAKRGKLKGQLQLDQRTALLAGGESGPAVVAGKPAESLLLQALKHDGLEMPPDEKLRATVIADFERWIEAGAFDPREGAMPIASKTINFTKSRNHWSFRAVRLPMPPAVRDEAWPKSDIDRFILAKLEGAELEPSADATDRVFVRRLYLDLIGLPPTPDQVQQFIARAATDREAAVNELVDDLLASPHFGERWGRHWLDVVRFAESNGRDQNIIWHHAWRYRQ